jgi:hypothetical protein
VGFLSVIKKLVGSEQAEMGSTVSQPLAQHQFLVEVEDAAPENEPLDLSPSKADTETEPEIKTVREKMSTSFESLIQNDIPSKVMQLMWFKDGSEKKASFNEPISFHTEGFTFNISFKGAVEPSLISYDYPVTVPEDPAKVERPSYYTSFEKLTPEQRWVYLDWLNDVDREIDIGYVFIFYYGLERHLFFGRYEDAFAMILRLRKVHQNGSFLEYSTSALITTSIMKNRVDLFRKFLASIEPLEEEDLSSLYLLAKRSFGMDLTTSELILLSGGIGFSKRQYIDGKKELFETELKKYMMRTLEKETVNLRSFDILESPVKQVLFTANYSVPEEQRVFLIPDIRKNKSFQKNLSLLLNKAHEAVNAKEKVRPAPKKKVAKAGKPGKTESLINCPYCESKIRSTTSKRICQSCKNTVYSRVDPDTKKRSYVTEEEAKRFDARKKDLQLMRFAVKTMWPFGMTAEQIELTRQNLKGPQSVTINDAVWMVAHEKMMEWENEGKSPSPQCYLALANFLEFEGKDKTEMMRKFEEEDGRVKK